MTSVKFVDKEERKRAKVWNFGLAYGMAYQTIAKDLKISEEEAKVKYDFFFSRIPRLKALIDSCNNFAYENKYIKTAFGRMRTLDWEKIPARPASLRQDYIKKAFNTHIQGSAADLFKMALLRLDDLLLSKYPEDIQLMGVVHDESVFYVRKSRLEEFAPLIIKAMRVPVPQGWAPFDADLSYGPSWSENEQQDYTPPSDIQFDVFTSWKDVIPNYISSHLEDENYIVKW